MLETCVYSTAITETDFSSVFTQTVSSYHLFCSLVRALTSEYYQSYGTQGERITDGIDITTWNVNRKGENVIFSCWDFAGQTVYYNTHQVFIIKYNRSLKTIKD